MQKTNQAEISYIFDHSISDNRTSITLLLDNIHLGYFPHQQKTIPQISTGTSLILIDNTVDNTGNVIYKQDYFFLNNMTNLRKLSDVTIPEYSEYFFAW